MAERLKSIEDNNLTNIYINNDGKLTIRDLHSESSLHNIEVTQTDEKIFKEMGIVKIISPLIVDSNQSDRIDDSFTEELNFVSTNLKELLEKTKNVYSMENSINGEQFDWKTKSEETGDRCSSLNDSLTELKGVLPEDFLSGSYQEESDILPDAIKYIKWLDIECNQRQEIKQQIKCLFIQLIKSALTLRHLKDVTKATVTDKSTE